jgi:predicted aminopeptidase
MSVPVPPNSSRYRFGALLALLATLAVSGCSPLYVLRSGYEEARILWRRQPIDKVLEQRDLAPEKRAKLVMVLDVRAFARDTLGLRVGGSFSSVAQVDNDQIVYVLGAARRDRLEAVTWWFPIVGRVPYKGFFDEVQAQSAAASLEAEGFDTIVQPSVAFSTLGWFDDPLLSNLLRYDRVTLAEVVIHELTHNTRYIPGQTAFDESFADFVGQCGAAAFFRARGDLDRATLAEHVWHDARVFSRFLGDFATRLRAAYATGIDDRGRQRLFVHAQKQFRDLPLLTDRYADFGREPLNNALVLRYLLYNDRLSLFETALAQEHGKLAPTIATVLKVVADAPDPYAALARRFGVPNGAQVAGSIG